MTTRELVFDHIKGHIAEGKLEQAIREMRSLAPNRQITEELKKYQFLLTRLKVLGRQGILGSREQRKMRSKVHLALLEVLSEVEHRPSGNGLFTEILQIPLRWKLLIFMPLAIAAAVYFTSIYPYPLQPLLPEQNEQAEEYEAEESASWVQRVGP